MAFRAWYRKGQIMNRSLGISCLALGVTLLVNPAGWAQDAALVEKGIASLEAVEAAYQQAIARAKPSVVSVYVVSRNDSIAAIRDVRMLPPMEATQGIDFSSTAVSIGSGVIIDERGLVLTCFHVVRSILSEPSYRIVVSDSEGQRYEGRLYAADPRSDLASIELLADEELRLPVIKIGNGSNLPIGKAVLAIGNPFGLASPDGATSVSAGIISNLRRRPAASPQLEERSILDYGTLVQTDARLNMGVSGGALINIHGELIGITMALAAAVGYETPGGFALPTDDLVRRIIETLREGKEVEYGFIGIEPRPITAAGAEQMGYLPVDGIKVERIFEFVPAFRKGLQSGDIITSVSGKPIKDPNDLILAVGSLPVGTEVDAEIVRRKDRMNLKIPLAKYGVSGDVIATNKRPSWNGIRVDHLSTIARERLLGNPYEGLDAVGVVIKDLSEPSAASDKGLRAGQVIRAVNGQPVYTPDEFEQKVTEAKGPVRLQIFRGEEVEIGGEESAAENPEASKP